MDTGRSDDENPATDTLHRAHRMAEKTVWSRVRCVRKAGQNGHVLPMFYLKKEPTAIG
jgi:hypothetical protein